MEIRKDGHRPVFLNLFNPYVYLCMYVFMHTMYVCMYCSSVFFPLLRFCDSHLFASYEKRGFSKSFLAVVQSFFIDMGRIYINRASLLAVPFIMMYVTCLLL